MNKTEFKVVAEQARQIFIKKMQAVAESNKGKIDLLLAQVGAFTKTNRMNELVALIPQRLQQGFVWGLESAGKVSKVVFRPGYNRTATCHVVSIRPTNGSNESSSIVTQSSPVVLKKWLNTLAAQYYKMYDELDRLRKSIYSYDELKAEFKTIVSKVEYDMLVADNPNAKSMLKAFEKAIDKAISSL